MKIIAERDLLNQTMKQIATQPRNSLSRRLATSTLDLISAIKKDQRKARSLKLNGHK